MAHPKSTARNIPYDLRPAKQSERGILIDLIKIGGDAGLKVRDYRYVGMGANRFYDYLLMHKALGVRRMVSLEHDAKMFERARFNVPFRFIDVRHETVATFLNVDARKSPEIVWLDYDGGLAPDIAQDIASLAVRAGIGDFAFVTLPGTPPRSMERNSDVDRLIAVQEVMGELAGGVQVEDVERIQFHLAVHKILVAAFRNAFALRHEGSFVFLMQVRYKDGVPMVTVGGAFLDNATAEAYTTRVKTALPFLPLDEAIYSIPSFSLTERERHLFDRAVTSHRSRCAEKTLLEKMGFDDEDWTSYGEILRYLPRYVETAI